jgi:hypothetical protein
VATAAFFWREKGLGLKVTTHLYLVPRFRMSGALPLLPIYTFITWTGYTLLYCGLTNINKELRTEPINSTFCSNRAIDL